jgi:DNA polymerase I-like protein with 3'-5' exonuclease and polymerase domains
VEKETPIPPWYTGLQDAGWLGKNGYFSTSDEVLSTIEERCVGSLLREFVATIKEWREKQKQLTTYYDGLRKLLMPDGCIHPNYNHALTVTGRLSSSEPNLQNITNGPIKKAFVSRWGKDGVVLEADYSQLEMVALAVLSHDEQMLSDIRDGVDMHNALYQEMYGKPLSKEERKKFKRCSFALVYGASANGIATQSGLPVEEARRFIDTFYARYKGVERWHQETLASVRGAREASPLKDSATGIPIGTASWISPVSNRIYTFKEYVNPEDKRRWAGLTSFSPTEVKNYPVQGTATGDIVPMMVGRLYRVLRNNPRLANKALLVNTVHDSVELDVHKSVLNETIEVVRAVLESAPAEIKHTFDYNFPLPLKVGVSYGPNWFEQTEVEFTSLREAA